MRLPLVAAAAFYAETDPEQLATIPVAEGQVQPLCGFYSQKILPELKEYIEKDEIGLIKALKTLFLTISTQ